MTANPATPTTPARDSFVFLLLMASVFVVPLSLAFMGRMAHAAPAAELPAVQVDAHAG